MVKIKCLNIHYEHTTHLYSQLNDYFTFMVHDGNIEKSAYDLMKKTLDELYYQYRDVYADLADVRGELNKELVDDGKD